ncbi:MAG: cell division protein FtsA [Candidatus Omnitrophica bacterium]|nr:cell division protein FtsA [Candidatus Omnitrophota bacterium]MCM8790696.1 cell division protein FtsA [Candidatus Omnitrophota bacterium]
MKRPYVITGVDIGSHKIAGVTAKVARDGILEIVAQASVPSQGVSRGVLVDLNAAISSVSKVFDKLKSKTHGRLGDIYVNISGEDVKGTMSTGMIPLALRGREVTASDMARCLDVASTIYLPFDREIIHKVVQGYSIDDQPWINDPIGLYAARLACEVFVITANANHIQSIYKCVDNAGHDVKGVIFSGMADGASLLEKQDIEKGVGLIDMGSSITELSIFSGGSLAALDIMPIGAQDITGDFRDNVAFRTLYETIDSRIKDFGKACGKVSSLVLTGGLAFTDGIIEFLEEKIAYPIKMGIAREVRGEVSGLDSARLSTAIGLVRYIHEKRAAEDVSLTKRLTEKVVELFNNYF